MNRLLICGASVRSLAQSAVRTGWVPWCIDFFADADLLTLLKHSGGRMVGTIDSFRDLPQLVALVPNEIPLLWGGGLENEPDLLEELSQHRTILGSSVEAVRRSRDLPALHRMLSQQAQAASCVKLPTTHWPNPEPPKNKPVPSENQTSGQRWLFKPWRSAGGLAISETTLDNAPRSTGQCAAAQCADGQCADGQCADGQCADGQCADGQVTDGKFTDGKCRGVGGYLQQYVQGAPLSAMFVVAGSELELVGCSLQLTGWPSLNAAGFQFCGNFGPVNLPQTIRQQLHSAASSIVATTGLTGVFGIDFVLSHGQLWLLEVNPRITASHEIYELTSERHLVAAHGAFTAHGAGHLPALEIHDSSHWLPENLHFCRLLRMVVYQSADKRQHMENRSSGMPATAMNGGVSNGGVDNGGIHLWLADLPAELVTETAIANVEDQTPGTMPSGMPSDSDTATRTPSMAQSTATAQSAPTTPTTSVSAPLLSVYIGIRRSEQLPSNMMGLAMGAGETSQPLLSAGVNMESAANADDLARQAVARVVEFLQTSGPHVKILHASGVSAEAVAASLQDLMNVFLYHCSSAQTASNKKPRAFVAEICESNSRDEAGADERFERH